MTRQVSMAHPLIALQATERRPAASDERLDKRPKILGVCDIEMYAELAPYRYGDPAAAEALCRSSLWAIPFHNSIASQ